MRSFSESGQSTVEAAFLLPILIIVLGLLLQPAILLYNRCIMNEAASEGCRLVETNTNDDATTHAFFIRRLSAIPDLSIFHDDEDWDISWSGGELGQPVTVKIVNHAYPLPLFGVLAGLAGNKSSDGRLEQTVEISSALAPDWASALGSGPSDWIGSWK